jgi:hypothetical protein
MGYFPGTNTLAYDLPFVKYKFYRFIGLVTNVIKLFIVVIYKFLIKSNVLVSRYAFPA